MKRLKHIVIAALALSFTAAQVSPVFAISRVSRPGPPQELPAALRLSGTASADGKHWLFEILINRFGSYFRKEWSGKERSARTWSERKGSAGKGDNAGFYRIVLIAGQFRGEHQRLWGPMDIVTSTGLGNSKGPNDHEVALRLVHNGHIEGYSPGVASVEWMNGKIIERFQRPLHFGDILVPATIIWNDSARPKGRTSTTYSVQHVQILNSAEQAVFDTLLREDFPMPPGTHLKPDGPPIHAQNSALPGLRGNGMTSRMFFMPVR